MFLAGNANEGGLGMAALADLFKLISTYESRLEYLSDELSQSMRFHFSVCFGLMRLVGGKVHHKKAALIEACNDITKELERMIEHKNALRRRLLRSRLIAVPQTKRSNPPKLSLDKRHAQCQRIVDKCKEALKAKSSLKASAAMNAIQIHTFNSTQ